MFGTSSSSPLWLSLQPSGNPLVRNSDRRQARLAAVLLTLALIAGPIVAAYGLTHYAGLIERATQQQESRSQVTAVLLEKAPVTEPANAGAVAMPRRMVARAEWSTADGAQHQGQIPVTAGAKRGDQVPIWVDRDGNRVAAPLTTGEAAAAAVLVSLGSWLLVAAALGGIYALVRARLDRERYAAWEREWRELDEHHA